MLALILATLRGSSEPGAIRARAVVPAIVVPVTRGAPRAVVEPPLAPAARTGAPLPSVVVPIHRLAGIASYYRHRPGEAAAGPALRRALGDWRGRYVTVCRVSCLRVRLTDWCGCPGGRVIDLDYRVFRALGALSRGLLEVRVSW